MNDQDGLDEKLQQLYRKLPKEQPDTRLDEIILKAARNQPLAPRRWQQPFAIAASVVMVGSLLLYWRVEEPLQLERAVSVKESAPPVTPATAPELEMAAAPPPAVAMAPAKPATMADEVGSYAAKSKMATGKAREELDQLTIPATKEQSEKKIQSYSGGSGLAGLSLNDEKTVTLTGSNQGAAAIRQKRDEIAQDAAPAPELAEAIPPVASAPAASAMGSAGAGKAEGSISADSLSELRADSPVRAQTAAPAPTLAKRSRAAAAAEASAEPAKAKPVALFNASIEGVSLGISLEQLQTLGFSCGNDVCRKLLSQPEQASYWGIPSLNARLKVFISRNLASKLVLEQTPVDIVVVQAMLLQLGQATDKVCVEEKGEMLVRRQVQTTLIHLRQQGQGAILTVCADH